MNKKEILKQFWRGASEKEGWYPPYADALKDVDANLSDWRAEKESGERRSEKGK